MKANQLILKTKDEIINNNELTEEQNTEKLKQLIKKENIVVQEEVAFGEQDLYQ